jgi:hypothetical protein
VTKSEKSSVLVEFTNDEALVLFDWLSREIEKDVDSLKIIGEDWAAANALLSHLEQKLVEPFQADYAQKVSQARLALAKKFKPRIRQRDK